MPTLSVAIITFNEEANLARTLRSVPRHAEIVIVDSGSTDSTVEIARQYGARVFEERWMGYAAQKNYAIEQCLGDWVLSLDADEEVSRALCDQITSLTCEQHRETEPEAYAIPRRNMFLGRWIRHGGFYPDAKLRLFRRGAAWFEQRPVHEVIQCDGPKGTLRGDLIHHAYPTLEGYIEHMNRYSSLGAEVVRRKGVNMASPWTFVARVVVFPVANFLWNYVVRFGFRDGREGLLLHCYHAAYSSWKYAKAWERMRS